MEKDRLFTLLEQIQPLPLPFKKALANELQSVKFPKGHSLVQALSVSTHAYFLEEGFAVSYYDNNTQPIVTGFWKEGDIIVSPLSFFKQNNATETIKLTVPGKLRSISRDAAKEMFEKFPVANSLAHIILSQNHALSQEKIIDLHTLDAWQRYNKLIERYPRVELLASQALIASYLNITRQSLSRLKATQQKSQIS